MINVKFDFNIVKYKNTHYNDIPNFKVLLVFNSLWEKYPNEKLSCKGNIKTQVAEIENYQEKLRVAEIAGKVHMEQRLTKSNIRRNFYTSH